MDREQVEPQVHPHWDTPLLKRFYEGKHLSRGCGVYNSKQVNSVWEE
jgi:hypothetical protein